MDIGKIIKEGDRVMPGWTPPAPGQPVPAMPEKQPAAVPAPVKPKEKVPA